jgi:hypothetical protein
MNKMETLTIDFIVLVVYRREWWLRMMLNEQGTVSFILEESIGKLKKMTMNSVFVFVTFF